MQTNCAVPSPSSFEEDELIAAARAGNEAAFARLVSRYAGTLHRLSSRLASAAERDDIAQEGLLGLLSAVQTYRGGAAAFGTYAHACMRNRMVSAVRRARAFPPEFGTPSPAAATAETPEQLLERREELRALRACLRRLLSAREYQVLTLYLSSYSYEEIAATLGVGRKAVDNALQRARRKLAVSRFSVRL